MEILGMGIDVLEVERMQELLANPRTLSRIFTDDEIKYIGAHANKAERAAGIFCAKEAVVKALGTGFGEYTMKDISITHNSKGKPLVDVKGVKNIDIQISISHSQTVACANAIAIKK